MLIVGAPEWLQLENEVGAVPVEIQEALRVRTTTQSRN
jgi:hypothetical protein